MRRLCLLQGGARLEDAGGRARLAGMSPLMAFFCSATFYELQRTDENRPGGGKRRKERDWGHMEALRVWQQGSNCVCSVCVVVLHK